MSFVVPYEQRNIYSTIYQSIQINNIILEYTDENSIITDATACIGGNSYFFCKKFKFVNCVEINERLFDTLKNNIQEFKNKILYNCSYNIIKFLLKQDVVFIDPPWGGELYKTRKKIELYLDDINVFNIVDSLYNHTKIVALKVPNNFNRTRITCDFWKHRIYSINKNRKSIYKLIIFYKPV